MKYLSLSLLIASCTILPGCGACTEDKETKTLVATEVTEAAPLVSGGQDANVTELSAPVSKGVVTEFYATRGDAQSQLTSMIAQGTAVVDFYAQWCGPCKALAPQLANLARERTDVTFIKVDVDKFPQFNIRSMPTIVIYKNGVEVKRVVGANLAAIKDAIK